MTVLNSIVAGNTGGDCYGTDKVTSQGYNIESGTSCSFTDANDQQDTDPLLDPLADNGGPTQTHALQAGSPAVEAIPDGTNGCSAGVSTDQRGAVRADGSSRGGTACEIGSYEYDSNQIPNAITLQSLNATATTPANWLVATLLAGFATLVGAFVLRKRSL